MTLGAVVVDGVEVVTAKLAIPLVRVVSAVAELAVVVPGTLSRSLLSSFLFCLRLASYSLRFAQNLV